MKPFWFFGIPLRGVLVLMIVAGYIAVWPAFLTTVPASVIYIRSMLAVMGIIFFLGSFPKDSKMTLKKETMPIAKWLFTFVCIGTWFGMIVFTDSFGEAWYQMLPNVLAAWMGFFAGLVTKLILLGARAGFEWAFHVADPEKKER